MSEEQKQGQRDGASAGATVWALVKVVFTLLVVAASISGVYNVFGVREQVLALASDKACEGQTPCKATMTLFEASPFSHHYQMATPKGTMSITCKRPYIFAGDFACTNDSVASAEPAGGGAPASSGSSKAGRPTALPMPKASH